MLDLGGNSSPCGQVDLDPALRRDANQHLERDRVALYIRLRLATNRFAVTGIDEREVVTQIEGCEPTKIGECLGQREPTAVQVDVESRTA